jgi:hypothetical protein
MGFVNTKSRGSRFYVGVRVRVSASVFLFPDPPPAENLTPENLIRKCGGEVIKR